MLANCFPDPLNATRVVCRLNSLSRSSTVLRYNLMLAAATLVYGWAPVALAQETSDLQPYDAGYAVRAAELCPGLSIPVKFGPEMTSQAPFVRGAAMFDLMATKQSPEAACKAALNLYDAQTGKVAKLLGRK
jgi:hypothetical protein